MAQNYQNNDIAAFRLYEKTSAKGNQYLTGRWGNVKVTVLKSNTPADDGSPIWNVRLSQAAEYKPREADTSHMNGSYAVTGDARPVGTKIPVYDEPDEEVPF